MSIRQISLAFLVVAVVIAPMATAAGTQQAEGYSGTHVAFDAGDGALVDYAVNGETVFESVKVQSESQVGGGLDVGADLSAVSGFSGAGLSVSSRTAVRATVTSDSGAELVSHDNSRGILVVSSGGSGQYVSANLSGGSQASQEDDKVVVTTQDGTEGTFLVVGDGEVAVNERGNVTARLGSDGRLVYRSYPDGRSEEDSQQEELISSGQAATEVYVLAAEEGGQQGQDQAADVVSYSQDTTVEVTEQSEGTLRMTADRSQREGRVIICTLSEQAFGSVDDVEVTVDGEAAASVSSYSELQSATQDGDQSAYMVRQQSSAEASGEVLVGVNHFSTREVAVNGTGEGTSDGFGPGFGTGAALVALVAVAGALFARRRA